jgi:Pvc16 N-terminal domain
MIHDVDEALRKLVLQYAVNGSGAEVSFDAPTKDWAARRNAPTVNVYLYDVREDLDRREVQFDEIRDDSGRVTERRPPPRRYKLSYLVTCWTQRPEDEHRLLSSLLAAFLKYETVPREVLPGTLAESPHNTFITIALPPPKDRSLADVWSALGGELKPSLDLVVTAPMDAGRVAAAGPPVLEEPKIGVVSTNGDAADASAGKKGPARKGKKGAKVEEPEPKPVAEESFSGGDETTPGRRFSIRDTR